MYRFAGLLGISEAGKCYVCSGLTGECSDQFTATSSLEVDCSGTSYVDDGDCSKLKTFSTVLGVKVYTGKSLNFSTSYRHLGMKIHPKLTNLTFI